MAVSGGNRLILVVLDVNALKLLMSKNQMLKRYFQSFKYLEFDNGSSTFYKKLVKRLPQKQVRKYEKI